MGDFLEFVCSACGKQNLVDPDDVPPGGGTRSCQSCGASMSVSLEGGASLRAESLPAFEETIATGDDLSLRMPSGRLEQLSPQVIEQGIQSQRVLPWDLVTANGQEFLPISEVPEFQNLFLPSDFTPVQKRMCSNHPGGIPTATCRRCGRGYCQSCVESIIQIEPRLCPACNGGITEADPRLTESPPWERPREVASYPVLPDGWKLTLTLGIILWLSQRSVFMMPVSLLAIPILTYVLVKSSDGTKSLPVPALADLKKVFRQLLPIILVTVVFSIPLVAARFLLPVSISVFVQLPIWAFTLVFFPMAIGLSVLTGQTAPALDFRAVGRAIWARREEYVFFLLLWIAIGVFVLACQTVVSFVPWLGRLLGALASAYGSVVQAHLLGWYVWMHRETILAAARV